MKLLNLKTWSSAALFAVPVLVSQVAVTQLQRDAGYQAFLVGGGVRDILAGITPKDFDIATDAHPEQIKNLFRSCRLIGRRFVICHVRFGGDVLEVTTFRGSHDAPTSQSNPKGKHSARNEAGMLLRDNVYGSIDVAFLTNTLS